MKITPTELTVFPTLTICSTYRNAYKEDFLRSHGTSSRNYRRGIIGKPIPDGWNMEQFHKMATHNLDEILDTVQVRTTARHRSSKVDSWTFTEEDTSILIYSAYPQSRPVILITIFTPVVRPSVRPHISKPLKTKQF